MPDKSKALTVTFAAIVLALVSLTLLLAVFEPIYSKTYHPGDWMEGESFWGKKQSFHIGVDNDTIPIQLPGPMDPWAGGERKGITLELPFGRIHNDVKIQLTLFDSHESHPPLLAMIAGGRVVAQIQVEAGHGVGNDAWQTKGRPSIITHTFPKELFADGATDITIRSESGSWAAIRAIEVWELAPGWAQGIVETGWITIVSIYVIYVSARRRWKAHLIIARGALTDAREMSKKAFRDPVAVGVAVFLSLAIFFTWVRQDIVPFSAGPERRIHGVIGDEGEYFIAAYSLAHDGDMDVSDNVRAEVWRLFQGIDYWENYHGSLAYFQRVTPVMKKFPQNAWGGAQLLVHRPGLSVLISPATLFKDRLRWWSYFIISTTAAMGMGLAVYLLAGGGAPPLLSGAVIIATVISPPSLFYMNQAFPEMPMAVLAFLAVCALVKPTLRRVVLASVIVAALPWFSDRGVPAGGILGLVCLILAPGKKGKLISLGIFLAGAGLLARYYYNRFGVPYPVDHHPYFHASLSVIPEGLPRVILDRARGFIWLAPVLSLAPAAFYFWWRSSGDKILPALTAAGWAASILAVASHPDWTGGGCASGRYAVIFQWLAVPAFIMWARHGMSGAQKALFMIPLLFGAVEGLLICRPAGWMYSRVHPLFQYKVIQPYYDWLPDMQGYTGGAIALAVVWGAVFTAYLMMAFVMKKKSGDETAPG